MSRLQKKCFLGATSLHGLLLLALLIGPGFFNQPRVDDAPMIEILPMMVTDDKKAGGGAPQPAPAMPQPVVQPQAQPAPPPPQRTETVQRPQPTPPKVEPAKTEPPKVVRKDAEPAEKRPTNVRPTHQVQVSQRVVSLANNQPTPARPTPSPTPTTTANNAAQQAISRAQERLRAGLSSTTRVDMPEGTGGGGVSYANYGQIVRRVYTDAWLVPDDMNDDEATIKVSVTVARDGKVLNARITQPSGSPAANRSIQNTLDRIRDIGYPFPEGAKESQRTFIMTFNLKAKKAFG